MHKYIELIKKTSLLKSLTTDEIAAYLRDGSFRVTSYGKNNIVHFEGELCSTLELILAGQVVVERIDEAGKLMNIAEFFHDDILGGNLLFSKNPYYPMCVTTKEPSVILAISKDRLFQLFTSDQQLLRKYLELIADHAVILGDKIKHYVNRSIRESIISFLKYESKKQKSNHIKLTITKKALAEKIGVQRTSLSRELAKMKKLGLINYDAKSITILDKHTILKNP
jgi:CRP-like cAMP-binding protein